MSLDKGIFTLSIDFEFAWGYVDKEIFPSQAEAIRKEAETTLRLLAMFDKYHIPATWAIVGHLLENDCSWNGRQPHGDWPRPIVKDEKKDWFWQHPEKGICDVLWFDAENLISRIKKAPAGHEIASHSYAHIIYGDKKTDNAAIKKDIEKARQIHKQNNLPFRTFVFPRNIIGRQELLSAAGITCYRDNHLAWYRHLPGALRKIAHLLDYYLPAIHTSTPKRDDYGLIAIDGGLLLIGRNGLRKLVRPRAIKRKAKRGIARAIGRKEVFQLWFHPSNFVFESDVQFNILEDILLYARRARDAGQLEILTLDRIAVMAK